MAQICIYVSEQDQINIERQAKKEGQTISRWIVNAAREKLNDASKYNSEFANLFFSGNNQSEELVEPMELEYEKRLDLDDILS